MTNRIYFMIFFFLHKSAWFVLCCARDDLENENIILIIKPDTVIDVSVQMGFNCFVHIVKDKITNNDWCYKIYDFLQ